MFCSEEKYIKMVKLFVQDLPDGVKFTPEFPAIFNEGYIQSPEFSKDTPLIDLNKRASLGN